MRLLICAGGTGGGVYPALTVYQALANEKPDVLWVGSENGMEKRLVERMGIPFSSIPAAGLHGVNLTSMPGNILRLGRGVLASRRILKQFQPDVIFFTGGYVAAPMAIAGRGIPTLLFVPDIEPGKALKFLARFSTRIAIPAENSRRFFNSNTRLELTGYPTRPELATWQALAARKKMGVTSSDPVLLVYGGSKGARSINRAVHKNLQPLLSRCEVIHVTGQLDWPEVQQTAALLTSVEKRRYHVFPYLDEEMGAALRSASLVVCRAGASTLGELPLFGLPAILVPYPHAWRYQKVNADYLARQGGARILRNEDLNQALLKTVNELLDNPATLDGMRASMKSLARPDAATKLANLILQMAKTEKTQGNKLWLA